VSTPAGLIPLAKGGRREADALTLKSTSSYPVLVFEAASGLILDAGLAFEA
jgi:hypothetical protein